MAKKQWFEIEVRRPPHFNDWTVTMKVKSPGLTSHAIQMLQSIYGKDNVRVKNQ